MAAAGVGVQTRRGGRHPAPLPACTCCLYDQFLIQHLRERTLRAPVARVLAPAVQGMLPAAPGSAAPSGMRRGGQPSCPQTTGL